MLLVKYLSFTVVLFMVNALCWGSAKSNGNSETWAKTVESGKQRTTTLQFYFHDTLSGKSPSAIQVAQPLTPHSSQTKFGMLMMVDDPLTIGPDPKSKIVGRAQGLYGSASQADIGLLMALSYTFSDGQYNDSSISIMGRNPVMHNVREMPILGGTGFFRMARGYALAHTNWIDFKTGDAIVGYNVTILH